MSASTRQPGTLGEAIRFANSPSRGQKVQRALAMTLLATSLLLGGLYLAISLGFYGIAFIGLSTNIGHVKIGQEFRQQVTIANLTPWVANVTFVPTCGCETDKLTLYEVKPMSYIKSDIRFRITNGTTGEKERTVIMVYDIRGARHVEHGKVRFTLVR